jgi:hypothetical protein
MYLILFGVVVMTTDLYTEDDAAILQHTKAVRLKIVDHFIGDDRAMPRTQGEWAALHQALDGLDRTVFTKAKLKSDEQSQQQRQQVLDIVTAVLQRTDGQSMVLPVRTEVLPDLSSDFEVVPVPGEMDIGLHDLTYEQFMASSPVV